MAKRSGLGKGLDALFMDNNTEDGSVTVLKLSEIEPNQSQPRELFDEEALRELADSIRNHGIIQPLVVRPLDAGGYQVVAGERRWRAARMAGLSEVPVMIRQLGDSETLELAIIENLQREDLNPMELAQGYAALMDQLGMTQEQVADKIGKSRPAIANTLRLLNLPPKAQELVRSGVISTGHAKALLSLEDPELIIQVAGRVTAEGLLVRDIEKMARDRKKGKTEPKPKANRQTPADLSWGESYFREMELALSVELGRKVQITSKGKKSVLALEFYNNEELADIAARLTKSSW